MENRKGKNKLEQSKPKGLNSIDHIAESCPILRFTSSDTLLVSSNISYLWLRGDSILIYLGDNCIVFETFTASIGDLMVPNLV